MKTITFITIAALTIAAANRASADVLFSANPPNINSSLISTNSFGSWVTGSASDFETTNKLGLAIGQGVGIDLTQLSCTNHHLSKFEVWGGLSNSPFAEGFSLGALESNTFVKVLIYPNQGQFNRVFSGPAFQQTFLLLSPNIEFAAAGADLSGEMTYRLAAELKENWTTGGVFTVRTEPIDPSRPFCRFQWLKGLTTNAVLVSAVDAGTNPLDPSSFTAVAASGVPAVVLRATAWTKGPEVAIQKWNDTYWIFGHNAAGLTISSSLNGSTGTTNVAWGRFSDTDDLGGDSTPYAIFASTVEGAQDLPFIGDQGYFWEVRN